MLPETVTIRKIIALEQNLLGLSRQWNEYAGKEKVLTEHIKELLKRAWDEAKAEQAAVSRGDIHAQNVCAERFTAIEKELEKYYET